MQIFVRSVVGCLYAVVEVEEDTAVGEALVKASDCIYVDFSRPLVMYAGKFISPIMTIKEANILKESSVLVLNRIGPYLSFEVELERKVLHVRASLTGFVEEIKYQIQDLTGIPIELQKLYSLEELKDGELLGKYTLNKKLKLVIKDE